MRLAVIAFLCGILWVQQWSALPSFGWAWLLLPLGVAAVRWPRPVLPLVFLLAGMLWAVWRASLILGGALPPDLEGVDVQVEGRIVDLPAPTERGVRFRFAVDRAWHAGQVVQVPEQVLLSRYRTDPALTVGDPWRFTVRLRRPHGFQNPGGFDYEAYLLQQRIRATGYVREDQEGMRLRRPESTFGLPWTLNLNRLRQQLSERFQQLLAGHRMTAIVTAFANGDDDAIPDAQWQVLNRTGTGHLVAISGMNIGWVAGLVYLLVHGMWVRLGRVALWIAAPRIAAVAALLAAVSYAALAGFAIPTQRALVMLFVVLGAMLTGRNLASSTVLALALFVVLLFDPLAVLAAGFWLSFFAVAVILYFVRSDREGRWQRLLAWGRAQWAIAIGLLPILLYLFQQTSVIAPVANLVAIPVIEMVVIPATLLGVVADLLLPVSIAAFLLTVAATGLEALWPLLEVLAQLPGAIWSQPAPPLWALAASLVGILLLLAPPGFPARWLGAVWLLPLILVHPAAPAPGEIRMTLLDVGQGLSVVVRTRSHSLVYDTGARFSARLDAGTMVVVPYLRHQGVDRLDVLVVSHGDSDHIGGSGSLLDAIPTARVYSSVAERIDGAQSCRAGQWWEWDGVRFDMLHPGERPRRSDNNRSCVLRITTPHGRILLPGDIGVRAERLLVKKEGRGLRAEVLVAPHHGSKTSSSEQFLEAVQPNYILIPFGYRNRYRHPHPQVLERYRRRGAFLAGSAIDGAIEVRLTADGLQLDRYRTTRRRYWFPPERLSASPPV